MIKVSAVQRTILVVKGFNICRGVIDANWKIDQAVAAMLDVRGMYTDQNSMEYICLALGAPVWRVAEGNLPTNAQSLLQPYPVVQPELRVWSISQRRPDKRHTPNTPRRRSASPRASSCKFMYIKSMENILTAFSLQHATSTRRALIPFSVSISMIA